jgi:transcriptional regulator with XRE-family HTH domain
MCWLVKTSVLAGSRWAYPKLNLASVLVSRSNKSQKYEKGAIRVGAGRLRQIADVLRVPIPTLFDGAPTAHRPAEQSARFLLAKPHALRLLLAFDKIKDEAARLAILHLIESIPRTEARSCSRKRTGA